MSAVNQMYFHHACRVPRPGYVSLVHQARGLLCKHGGAGHQWSESQVGAWPACLSRFVLGWLQHCKLLQQDGSYVSWGGVRLPAVRFLLSTKTSTANLQCLQLYRSNQSSIPSTFAGITT